MGWICLFRASYTWAAILTYRLTIMTLQRFMVQTQVRGSGGGTKWWHETVVALKHNMLGIGARYSTVHWRHRVVARLVARRREGSSCHRGGGETVLLIGLIGGRGLVPYQLLLLDGLLVVAVLLGAAGCHCAGGEGDGRQLGAPLQPLPPDFLLLVGGGKGSRVNSPPALGCAKWRLAETSLAFLGPSLVSCTRPAAWVLSTLARKLC